MIYYSSANIKVRDIEERDSINLFMWNIDRELYMFDPIPIPNSAENLIGYCKEFCIKFKNEIMNENHSKRKYKYFIITDDNDNAIGYVNMFGFNEENHSCELGVIIGDKRYWNKGIGYEAVRLVMDYAFTNMNLKRIFIETGEHNINAIKLFNKLKFRKCDEYLDDDFKFIVMEKTII